MDLRQIRSFIAVAEELHFRRAAERLGMAQTALSSQVRSLEEELGFALLFRTTRHVSLTQAGAVFLDEARAVLDRLETGVERASIAASQGLNRLRLGGIDAALVWFLPPVIDRFRKRFADIRLPLTEVSASKLQVQELLRHRIDVAFFRPPTSVEGVAWETLFEEDVFVALPAASPLVDRPRLSAKDLQDTKIITYARHARPLLSAMVMQSFEAAGVKPDIELEVLDKSTLLALVAQGIGAGLVPQWTAQTPVKGVEFRRYDSAVAPLKFGVAWRQSDDGETLRAFLDLTREEAQQIQARFAAGS
jgi:DNA-binding transcriptional LysR family regulator